MRTLFLFEYNIPFEDTTTNEPDVFVAVRVTEFNNGKTGIEFLDLNTNLIVKVKDWMKVWSDARKLAEIKTNEYKNNAKAMDHSLIVNNALS